jgi:hypothetical protein
MQKPVLDRAETTVSRREERLLKFLAMSYGVGLLWQQLNGNVSYWEFAWDSSLWAPLAADWSAWLKHTAPLIANGLLYTGSTVAALFTLFLSKNGRQLHLEIWLKQPLGG